MQNRSRKNTFISTLMVRCDLEVAAYANDNDKTHTGIDIKGRPPRESMAERPPRESMAVFKFDGSMSDDKRNA